MPGERWPQNVRDPPNRPKGPAGGDQGCNMAPYLKAWHNLTKVCSLQSAVGSLQSTVGTLQSTVHSLQSSVSRRQWEVLSLRFAVRSAR